MLDRPPREALTALEDDAVDEVRVGVRRRLQHEPLGLGVDQVDEAGVDAARVGEEADDRVEHVVELEGRADGAHDREERVVVPSGGRVGRHVRIVAW